ncbi:MAG: NusG domain II-containing protein [Acutalibacteraceae bacterium]|nr:NusG domain II-containing protein [Acutalibacteraceae bacterium]
MNVKLFKKADLIVIAVITVIAGLFLFFAGRNTSKPVAEISVDGKIIQTLDLYSVKERTEIKPSGDYNILIVAENGKIRFEHSDCEDKLCVASGNLEKSGDIAVCLPAKTVITVKGSDLDAVVY